MVRKDQTSDVQLHIGESRDSGFDATRRPGMTPAKSPVVRPGLYYFDQRNRLRGFIRNRGIVAVGIALRIGISVSVSLDRKSTRLNSSHIAVSRMPSSA